MQGLSGQRIDWSGEDGGWYCLVKDDEADLQVNVRLTAPLPVELPHRQLMTGLAVLSKGHSLVVEVADPYSTATDGCTHDMSPCLADGGVRIIVDDRVAGSLLAPTRENHVAGGITMSAYNLPLECQQFGADKIWAVMHEEFIRAQRQLQMESFEDWLLAFGSQAAPEWCHKYVAELGLADVQTSHALFKITTPTITVRLEVGVNQQGDGEVDGDGRTLPDLDIWQMDIGFSGLSPQQEHLSGLLGETARPVLDKNGVAVMEGFDAFRGTVEDYRVSDALGEDFTLLHEGI